MPKNFQVQPPSPKLPALTGAVTAAALKDPSSHAKVFEPLLQYLEESLPRQIRLVHGVPHEAAIPAADQLPHVTTFIVEHHDGTYEIVA